MALTLILISFTGHLFDLMLWGFTSRAVQSAHGPSITLVWLTGLVLWQGYIRSNLDMSLNLLVELWAHNVVNIFASPLKLREWIASAMIMGMINATIVVIFGGLVAYLIYGVNILSTGTSDSFRSFYFWCNRDGWLGSFQLGALCMAD